MEENDKEGPLFVFFLDCLGEEDLKHMEYLSTLHKGRVESGIPRVTPKIVTEAMTGESPTETGMLCPIRLDQNNLTRPFSKTVMEWASEERRVLNFEIPFTIGQQGRFLTNIGSSPGAAQQERPGVLMFPKSQGNMWEEEPEKLLQAHVDYIRSVMSSVRNLARNDTFDVFFISIRNLDSFGHFFYEDQRARLARYIDMEMQEFAMMGDMDKKIIAFSDHGAREKDETFFINRWLIENDYLDVKVLYNEWEKQNDDGLTQINVHSPYVEIKDSSQAVSPDSYDSGIKILDDDLNVEWLIDNLLDTGMFRGIFRPKDLYGKGKYGPETLGVDLVCDRADGVLVSGNIHKDISVTASETDKKCQGTIRSGVHTRYGEWFSNNEEEKERDVVPTDIHEIIKKNITRHAPKKDKEDLYGMEEAKGSTEEKVVDRLEGMGYL